MRILIALPIVLMCAAAHADDRLMQAPRIPSDESTPSIQATAKPSPDAKKPPQPNYNATMPMSATDVQLLVNLAVANDRLAQAQAQQKAAAEAAADVSKRMQETINGGHAP